MIQSNQAALSPLTEQDLAVLELYLNPQIPLEEIANRFKLSLVALLDVFDRPEITAFVQRMTAMHNRRARDIALIAMPASVARLQHLGETASNPELARKCLSAVVRVATRRETPGRTAGQRDRSAPTDEPAHAVAPQAPRSVSESRSRRDDPAPNVQEPDAGAVSIPLNDRSTRAPRRSRSAAHLAQAAGVAVALSPSVGSASA